MLEGTEVVGLSFSLIVGLFGSFTSRYASDRGASYTKTELKAAQVSDVEELATALGKHVPIVSAIGRFPGQMTLTASAVSVGWSSPFAILLPVATLLVCMGVTSLDFFYGAAILRLQRSQLLFLIGVSCATLVAWLN